MRIESILLSTANVYTFAGKQLLTNSTGFFFERDGRLYIITCRHVVLDSPNKHHPDRIEIEIHVGEEQLSRSVRYSIPLYRDGLSLWRACSDNAGDVDIAAIELNHEYMPHDAVYWPFTPAHLPREDDVIEVGHPVVVVGYPLGFQDGLHHLPVARQAVIASSYGLRFQGQGYFLSDARTHRGTSGAPVVARHERLKTNKLPWLLLGVHSARLDVGTRDVVLDEALGLNCVWYSDALMALTNRATMNGT